METLFFPCVADSHGRILKKVSDKPMTKEKAEQFLKTHFRSAWLNCEAIPQPQKMRDLHN